VTTANKITIARILLVPLFVVQVLYYTQTGNEVYRLLALLCLAVASISDAIDGYLARHYNQHSELGRVLDPLADKMLLVAGVVLLSMKNEPYLERIPMWLTATIVSRDIILIVGMVIIHYICGKVRVRPVILGKVATVLQMSCVLWVLLQWSESFLFYLALAAALCTGASGIWYVLDGVRQLSASPSSSPSHGN